MQTLGLSESTPRTENRLKSLLWPSIQTATDVDYLGTQGFWICAIVAVLSLIFLSVARHPIAGIVTFLFYFMSAVGVRERSRYAATMAFVLYSADLFFAGLNIIRIVFTAILLSNLRATWISSRWKAESEQATLPPRLNETIGDKLADQLPILLWPKARIFYYIFSAALLVMSVVGVIVIKLRRMG